MSGHITPNMCFYMQWDLRVTYSVLEHPGHETSTQYFSCSGGPGSDGTKARRDMLYRTCVFLHHLGSTGHVVHSGVSRAQNIDTQFFRLGWTRCGSPKKHAGTCYNELMFLHPVGSMGHVVRCGVSGVQNIAALFFIPGWTQHGSHKKCAGTRYVKLVFSQ
jgi:hypothetical protein